MKRRAFLALPASLAAGNGVSASSATTWLSQRLGPATLAQAEVLLAAVNGMECSTFQGVAKRAVQIGEALLGAGFALGPIGEGAGTFDDDPPLTFERFDCMTFVETVVALSRATSVSEFAVGLITLRYGRGGMTFTTRHHFAGAGWIPSAMVHSILALVESGASIETTLSVDVSAWYRRIAKSPMYAEKWQAAGAAEKASILRAAKDSLQLSGVVRFFPRASLVGSEVLKDGRIVVALNPNSPLNQVAGAGDHVSHMGFAVRRQGVWLLRAASQVVGKVCDVPLHSVLYRPGAKAQPYGAIVLDIAPVLGQRAAGI